MLVLAKALVSHEVPFPVPSTAGAWLWVAHLDAPTALQLPVGAAG